MCISGAQRMQNWMLQRARMEERPSGPDLRKKIEKKVEIIEKIDFFDFFENSFEASSGSSGPIHEILFFQDAPHCPLSTGKILGQNGPGFMENQKIIEKIIEKNNRIIE